MRGLLESMGMRSLLGLFGDRNASKLIDIVLAATARLPRTCTRPRRPADPRLRPRRAGPRQRLGSRVTVATDVSDEDFLAWMCASGRLDRPPLPAPRRGLGLARSRDAVRPPGDRERDGNLPRRPRGPGRPGPGRPPRSRAARGGDPGLVDDQDRRARIGAAAKAAMDELRRSEATAHGYAKALDGTLALLHDPGRPGARALGRGARRHRDHAGRPGRGLRLSYTRALDEFRPA